MSTGYAASGELTPRMRAVLQAAATGATAEATGRDLHISASTVNAIRSAACLRLCAPNITAAVATAVRRGDL